jgi:ABC-type antimicrobial peptide transport system permease subunit
MFYVSYMLSELRRRRGRTILTALGLGVGVGLVVTVSALSRGLDDAQAEVLKPLTGVGTDLSVSRPLRLSGSGGGPFQNLSPDERKQLQKENGGRRIGLSNLGEPGSHFSRDDFVSAAQLTFSANRVKRINSMSGVKSAAGGLTLSAVHIEGTVPEQSERPQLGPPGGGGQGGGPPRNIDVDAVTVNGVDQTHPALGAVTSGQLARGRYFSRSSSRREAILNISYARRKGIKLGETITLGGKTFTVIGFARTPLGGQASDLYVKLSQLQQLSGREGRVNTVYVRTTSGDQVTKVASAIKSSFDGASVTTASDLADRVSGSLIDAKNLTSKLGTALEIVGLLAAFLIASLLTLSSVTKRVRELGTLKALGWRQALVVRQVTGESLLQGLFGGMIGVALGLGGAALIGALAPTLKATVAGAASQVAGPGPAAFTPFGQGAVQAGSTTVSLGAPVSIGLLLLAVALALAGGLLSGAVGGLRAARLRPAEALRHLD